MPSVQSIVPNEDNFAGFSSAVKMQAYLHSTQWTRFLLQFYMHNVNSYALRDLSNDALNACVIFGRNECSQAKIHDLLHLIFYEN